ncbi:MAG: hemerythrin domain-containing protein [Actinomycetota bacterium]|nr:hemerythrin domain-containing protein [Actinomycetota bacterium]
MQSESLALALRREHQEIDAGIDACTAADPDSGALSRAIGALRRHIYLEEEFLFPLLRQAEPGLTAPILVMLREHAEIWPLLDELDRRPAAGSGAAGSGADLARQLTTRLLHHNLKEERVLYPRADVILSESDADRLRAFLAVGELPAGWVCLRARS